MVRKFRLPALLCPIVLLLCELISRPFAEVGICDDWSYILTSYKLASTGHLLYNGWNTAMIGWQLYLGAAFVKLFGASFTSVRMSTLLVAMVTAFLVQRTLVRSGITERNATIGTLALVLSPLYMMLSVTFMSDIQGLFAIVICLYSCLRALQASSSRAQIAWLFFAVLTNTICGSSRQIAWTGVIVIVPSTLWLLRDNRRVLAAGIAATFAGLASIAGGVLWLNRQPYTIHESLSLHHPSISHTFSELVHLFMDVPFLILPILLLFLPQIRKFRPWIIVVIVALTAGYTTLAMHDFFYGPMFLNIVPFGNWVSIVGTFESPLIQGTAPVFLTQPIQILFLLLSVGGLLCLVASTLHHRDPLPATPLAAVTWKQTAFLLIPFAIVYSLLLVPRCTVMAFDRYMLGVLIVPMIYMLRFYQERIQLRIPYAGYLLIAAMAIYAVAVTHNLFSFSRARIVLAAEVRAAGIPDTSVDYGWEYNGWVELQHSNYINFDRIVVPANAHVYVPPPPPGPCKAFWYEMFPHIHPTYGASFAPDVCLGAIPVAPVMYSRWLSSPGTLYMVRYTSHSW